ncbi:aspartyl-phosphate phosphatase Spo0E family protein [Cohnella faecalis]|uniref:Aspartyl-phosphate phosphatase Spo0E family protein n=1 Tax=Cohnella faecalis TaxID=2315694 RepID=A0A398CW25_9BACL|nr:aspartyl-phosphate phosphatase Spo0E family protein [Cohnella faecalis]RIE04087.1 aspartyl-phosphate phosphatase Spo0E family protein [Cohnella faecalis]
MDAAEHNTTANEFAGAHVISSSSDRSDANVGGFYSSDFRLSEEIDRLRSIMTDMFLKEASLTADSVIHISRQLDIKINEYMAHSVRGKQAR